MPDNQPDAQVPSHEEFVRLFSRHQRQVYAYIGTVLSHPGDIEEVLQETSVVLWTKFDTFNREKSFLSWARGIAHLQMLAFFRKQRRRMLPLEEPTIERLLAQRSSMEDQLVERRQALAGCVTQLRGKDRQLIEQCYRPDAKLKDVAEEIGRSPGALYHSLGRIRRWLFECVNRTMDSESRA